MLVPQTEVPRTELPEPEAAAPRPVDARALARWRQRLRSATEPPWLHAEAARRMAERLGIVRLKPQQVVDWGLQARHDHTLLAAAYPEAQAFWVDPDGLGRAPESRPWWRGLLGRDKTPAVVAPNEVPAGAAQLLWSTMLLHTVAEPQGLLAAWHRALAVDGFVMFCTIGPGTLQSLSALYAAQGWPAPLAPLVDMHDLGDMLVRVGFADPVMDQETVRLTWADAGAALAELRSLGLNASLQRPAGLRSPRWRQRLLQALEQAAGGDGRISLEFELVYGHAFKPPPRARLAAETTVALEDLRRMVRRAPPASRR
jgi:malonyl-CoA O-methyltransferase